MLRLRFNIVEHCQIKLKSNSTAADNKKLRDAIYIEYKFGDIAQSHFIKESSEAARATASIAIATTADP